MNLLLIVLGLILLTVGAESLVRGASRLAAAAGVSPLVIGLTVVAYGTSAPELAVSVKASFSGQYGIALGNVVGSNIFNVLFILGVSALIVPLGCARQLVRLDVPIMIAASVCAWVMALNGSFGRGEGAAFLIAILIYTAFVIREGRKSGSRAVGEGLCTLPNRGPGTPGGREQSPAPTRAHGPGEGKPQSTPAIGPRDKALSVFFIAVGLGLLVLGARWLVDGAAAMARTLGISELVIGLTIVGAGTSFPELATSVVASIRGERDIAVGNVVGSNIFNLLAVLGASAVIAPHGIAVPPGAQSLDIPVMALAAIVCLPIFFTHGEISRWEGALFLGYYVIYTVYLLLAIRGHEAMSYFRVGAWCVAVPLTGAALLFSLVHCLRTRRPEP